MEELKRLSECEELIMIIIWDADEAPDMALTMEKANKRYKKTWKPQTISTFLKRLQKKGFLKSYRKGRYTYYVPNITKQDYRKMVMDGIVKVLYAGNAADLIKELG